MILNANNDFSITITAGQNLFHFFQIYFLKIIKFQGFRVGMPRLKPFNETFQ